MHICRQATRVHQPSRDAAFWIVAVAFVVTMLGTTLPTPLYVQYQRDLGFGTLVITVIFAAYAAGVLAALVLFGSASDVVGRRKMLLAGLAFAVLSGVTFLLAYNVATLIVARLLSGLSAGIFTGTATAALVDLAEDKNRATLVATTANMGGLGAGPPLAGLLAQLAPEPLFTPFMVHLVLLGLVTTGIWLIPEPGPAAGGRRDLRMARLSVPAPVRGIFVRSAIAVFAGFAVLGLFTAIAPLLLRNLLDLSSPALAGLVVGALFATSTFAQIVTLKHLGDRAMRIGSALLAIGTLVLAAALGVGSLAVLIVAVVLAGAGQGTSFRSALALLTSSAPADRRGEVASSLFVVAYVAISLPIVGAGVLAQVAGLRTAGITFSLVVAVLAALSTRSFPAADHSSIATTETTQTH
jgi:MFS family permease